MTRCRELHRLLDLETFRELDTKYGG